MPEPSVLYHATYPSNVEDIRKNGLNAGTYFANTPGYAAGFLAIRGGVEVRGIVEKDINGKTELVSDLVVHDGAHVFAVPFEKVKKWAAPSYDHSRSYFPEDLECWVVVLETKPEDLIEYGYIPFKEEEK